MNTTDARGEKCRQSSSRTSEENLYALFAHKAGPHEKLIRELMQDKQFDED